MIVTLCTTNNSSPKPQGKEGAEISNFLLHSANRVSTLPFEINLVTDFDAGQANSLNIFLRQETLCRELEITHEQSFIRNNEMRHDFCQALKQSQLQSLSLDSLKLTSEQFKDIVNALPDSLTYLGITDSLPHIGFDTELKAIATKVKDIYIVVTENPKLFERRLSALQMEFPDTISVDYATNCVTNQI